MRPRRISSYDDGRVETVPRTPYDLPRSPRPGGEYTSGRFGTTSGYGFSGDPTGLPLGLVTPWHESRETGGTGLARHALHRFRHLIGKGPKGYQRPDPAILEDLCGALGDHHPHTHGIEVAVQDGVVSLTGTVETRGERWLAEDIAEDVRGVREVHNHLRVARPGAPR